MRGTGGIMAGPMEEGIAHSMTRIARILALPLALALSACLPSAAAGPAPANAAPLDPARAVERLTRIVNDYRQRKGLPRIPYSPMLSRVAQAHVDDMAAQGDGGLDVLKTRDPRSGERCSAHSWSSRGNWTPVCFTLDGRYAQAMYDKPREITRGAYRGDGIEIAAWSSMGITPEFALELWQDSRAHDRVILEEGVWRGSNWQAMGVALGGNFAFIWFGKEPDPGTR
jgi:hypothetical protein